jgi:PleD family two-component response regulator
MTLRVLVAESDAEDLAFLQEALTEAGESKYWTTYVHIRIFLANSWMEAQEVLSGGEVDILLLNPDLPDCHGEETFLHSQDIATQIPVILLLEGRDSADALRMVRYGAQDFLIKTEIDCAPLAHALATAIERHRLLTAARAGCVTDSLTGLPNRGSFFLLADRDCRLAEGLGRRLLLLVAELRHPFHPGRSPEAEQRRDLALVAAAEELRGLAHPTSVLARLEKDRFGMTVFDLRLTTIEDIWPRIHQAADRLGLAVGAAIFEPADPVPLEVLLDRAVADLTAARPTLAASVRT